MFEIFCSLGLQQFCPQKELPDRLDIVPTIGRHIEWTNPDTNPEINGVRKVRNSLLKLSTADQLFPGSNTIYNSGENVNIDMTGFAIWGQGGVISNTDPNLFGGRDLIIPDNIGHICLAPKEVRYTDHNIYQDLSKILRQCRQSAR